MKLNVGDKVRWTRNFLRATGQVATNDPLAFRQRGGTITAIEARQDNPVVTVRDADGKDRRGLSSNFVRVTVLEADG